MGPDDSSRQHPSGAPLQESVPEKHTTTGNGVHALYPGEGYPSLSRGQEGISRNGRAVQALDMASITSKGENGYVQLGSPSGSANGSANGMGSPSRRRCGVLGSRGPCQRVWGTCPYHSNGGTGSPNSRGSGSKRQPAPKMQQAYLQEQAASSHYDMYATQRENGGGSGPGYLPTLDEY